MVYKPSSNMMDLIMPEARRLGIAPQKLIDMIISKSLSVSTEEINNGKVQQKGESTTTN